MNLITKGEADYLEVVFNGSCIQKCKGCSFAKRADEDGTVRASSELIDLLSAVRERFPGMMNVFMATSLSSMNTDFALPKKVFSPSHELGLALESDVENSTGFKEKRQKFLQRLPQAFSEYGPGDDVDMTVELGYYGDNYKLLAVHAHQLFVELAHSAARGDLQGNVVGLGVTHNRNNVDSKGEFKRLIDFFSSGKIANGGYIDEQIKGKLPRGWKVASHVFMNHGVEKVQKAHVFYVTEYMKLNCGGRNKQIDCIINWRFSYLEDGFGHSVSAAGTHTNVERGGMRSLYITPTAAHLQHSSGNIKQFDELKRTHAQVYEALSSLDAQAHYGDLIEKLLAMK